MISQVDRRGGTRHCCELIPGCFRHPAGRDRAVGTESAEEIFVDVVRDHDGNGTGVGRDRRLLGKGAGAPANHSDGTGGGDPGVVSRLTPGGRVLRYDGRRGSDAADRSVGTESQLGDSVGGRSDDQ